MKNIQYILSVFILIIHHTCFAQDTIGKYDYYWQLGYDGGSLPPTGTMQMNFNYSPPLLDSAITIMDMNYANASICNRNGELQLYTNGLIVFNAQHKAVKNSASYNYSDYFDQDLYGLAREQAVLILPCPTDSNKYFFFHSSAQKSDPDLHPMRMGYSVIDMQADSARGEMIVKNHLLVNGMLGYGQITGCKHANGKDWWVIVPKGISNCYYTFLLRDSTVVGPFQQCIGFTTGTQDAGQVLFTGNGDKYIRSCNPNNLLIFDFDRCTGKLSNPQNYPKGGHISLSPSSRFLYMTSQLNIFQFDLQAPDIMLSQTTVGTYDGFIWDNNFPTKFFIPQLAPDGKIYVSAASSCPYLHVINYPDSQGLACNVVQRGINLPRVIAWGLPNMPHYRMGALPVVCDSILSNQLIEYNSQAIQLFPNPASEWLNIVHDRAARTCHLYNSLGQCIKTVVLQGEKTEVFVGDLPKGMYIYEVLFTHSSPVYGKIILENIDY